MRDVRIGRGIGRRSGTQPSRLERPAERHAGAGPPPAGAFQEVLGREERDREERWRRELERLDELARELIEWGGLAQLAAYRSHVQGLVREALAESARVEHRRSGRRIHVLVARIGDSLERLAEALHRGAARDELIRRLEVLRGLVIDLRA